VSPPPTRPLEKDAFLYARTPEPDAWSQRLDDLLQIRLLEDDWDGQGAKAPSTELVDSAIGLAEIFRQQGQDAPCRIVPGVNGTVLFEWQHGDMYEEIEVLRPFYAEGIRIVPGQEPVHWVVAE
jgi:hypothetical protein